MPRPLVTFSILLGCGAVGGWLLVRQAKLPHAAMPEAAPPLPEQEARYEPPAKIQPAPPCSPPMRVSDDGAPPDFAGIGIELLRLRGIHALPSQPTQVTRKELEERIAAWLTEHFGEDYGKRQGNALAALGAIPEKVDTLALRAAFWSHQIGAWYDAKDEVLYVTPPPEVPEAKENALGLAFTQIFREHAPRLFPPKLSAMSTDEWSSRMSLIAGDAALIRLLHSLANPAKGGGGGVSEDPDDPSHEVPIPNFLRELELAPFSVGLDFTRSLHSLGKFDQVNAAYDRPPLSGAELLDTSLYLGEAQFKPESVSRTDVKVNGIAPVWDDTLGAVAMVLFLKEHVPQPVAAEAVNGWRGDRLLIYPSGTARDHVAWESLWKDANSADAFFGAMRQAALGRYRDAVEDKTAPQGVFKLDGKERHVILTRMSGGRGVFYADAADAAFAGVLWKQFAGNGQ